MVGMSGKSNEPRGGTTGSSVQHSKKQQSSGHGKTQVSCFSHLGGYWRRVISLVSL